MLLTTGAALLGLVLYVSTLTFALRSHARARLSAHLPPDRQRLWLEWLDARASELPVVAAFLRWVLSLALLLCVAAWFADAADYRLTPRYAFKSAGTGLALLFFFAVAVPSALARYAGEAILARSLNVLRVIHGLLLPVAYLSRAVDFVVMRLLGKTDRPHDESERMEQEILSVVSEGELKGAVDQQQAEMIHSVVELADVDVGAIMTPRTDIVAVPADANHEQVLDIVIRAGHSRLPVYDGSLDRILGVLYAKDLLAVRPGQPFDARRLMRSVPFIPESKKIRDLLRELKQASVHIAIVLDEYGGTAGIVTFEDILEQVVGDIADEYDAATPPPIRRIDADTLEVDARVRVSEVREELNVALPQNGDYETIGGFVFSTLGRIPRSGEEFRHEGLYVRVIDAGPRKVNRVLVRALRQAQPA